MKNCLGAVFFIGFLSGTIYFEKLDISENFKRMELKGKSFSKGSGKGMFENFHFRQQLDTIEDHHNKHNIEDPGCSWTTPLENCLGAVFLLGFYKAAYILGNSTFLRIPKEWN